jgi:hypothetical protein
MTTKKKPTLAAHLHADWCPGTANRVEEFMAEKPPRDGVMRRPEDSVVGADIFERVTVPGGKLRCVRCVECGGCAYFTEHGEEPVHVEGR